MAAHLALVPVVGAEKAFVRPLSHAFWRPEFASLIAISAKPVRGDLVPVGKRPGEVLHLYELSYQGRGGVLVIRLE